MTPGTRNDGVSVSVSDSVLVKAVVVEPVVVDTSVFVAVSVEAVVFVAVLVVMAEAVNVGVVTTAEVVVTVAVAAEAACCEAATTETDERKASASDKAAEAAGGSAVSELAALMSMLIVPYSDNHDAQTAENADSSGPTSGRKMGAVEQFDGVEVTVTVTVSYSVPLLGSGHCRKIGAQHTVTSIKSKFTVKTSFTSLTSCDLSAWLLRKRANVRAPHTLVARTSFDHSSTSNFCRNWEFCGQQS